MKRIRRILITSLLTIAFPLLATSAFATLLNDNDPIISVLSEPFMMILFGVMLIAVAGLGKRFEQ